MATDIFLLNPAKTISGTFSVFFNVLNVVGITAARMLLSQRSRRLGDAKAVVRSFFVLGFPH